MAPLQTFRVTSDDEVFSFANGRFLLGIVCTSSAAVFGLLLLVTLCACCRKKGKKGKRKDEKPVETKAAEAKDSTLTDTKKSKSKSVKQEKSIQAPVKSSVDSAGGEKPDASKLRESRRSKVGEPKPPTYVDIGPPPPAADAPGGARYVEISLHENKPVPKKREPPPADRAVHGAAAYRTLYGVGDDFQASERQVVKEANKEQGAKKPAYLTVHPDAAPEAPKQRYLSWGLDMPKAPDPKLSVSMEVGLSRCGMLK